jgi:hypothetical protein
MEEPIMLPTIVFVLALFMSLGFVEDEINRIIEGEDSSWTDVFYGAAICIFWSWLYHLSH